jgi:hypothetical protein
LPGGDFLAGVRDMVRKLSERQIDRSRLQEYYLRRYSYRVLKQAWVEFLVGRG